MLKQKPEAKFRAKVCKELEQCNAKVYPIIGGVTKSGDGNRIYGQNPGMSDVIVVHRYINIVFLEFKAANGVLSAVQKRFLEEVNERSPFSGFVVRENKSNGSKSNGSDFDLLEYYASGFKDKISVWLFSNGKELIENIKNIKRGIV